MNGQIGLWKEYAETLAKQNQAKNVERQALNKQIQIINFQNQKMQKQCKTKQGKIQNQQEYILALESKICKADRAVYEINKEKEEFIQEINKIKEEKRLMEEELMIITNQLQGIDSQQGSSDAITKTKRNQLIVGGKRSMESEIVTMKGKIYDLQAALEASIRKYHESNQKYEETEERLRNIESLLNISQKENKKVSKANERLEYSNKSQTTEFKSYIYLKPKKNSLEKSRESSRYYKDSKVQQRKVSETPIRILKDSVISNTDRGQTEIKLPILKLGKAKIIKRNFTDRENIQDYGNVCESLRFHK